MRILRKVRTLKSVKPEIGADVNCKDDGDKGKYQKKKMPLSKSLPKTESKNYERIEKSYEKSQQYALIPTIYVCTCKEQLTEYHVFSCGDAFSITNLSFLIHLFVTSQLVHKYFMNMFINSTSVQQCHKNIIRSTY